MFFPVRHDRPLRSTPWLTMALIIANVVVFAATARQVEGAFVLRDAAGDPAARATLWNMFPVLKHYLWPVGGGFAWRQIASSAFLHADIWHLAFNMLFLWIFGDNIEDRLGHAGYLLFYLGCGALAAMAQAVADPLSFAPMIGASGAIAGVMGAYFLLYPQSRILTVVFLVIFLDIVEIPAVFLLGLWFLLQVGHGALSSGEPGGGVAFWAHVGGFAAGAVVGLYLRARRGSERHYWDGAA